MPTIKQTLITAAAITTLTAFTMTHPAVGLLAQPILGIKAIANGILVNYHWRHSKNEKGIPLCNDYVEPGIPHYMYKNTRFTANDLTRLEHEQKRMEARDSLLSTLKWMRGLAKCIIPILGLYWAISTELATGGSAPFECSGCRQHFNHWKDIEAIRWHIQNVKTQMQTKNITKIR